MEKGKKQKLANKGQIEPNQYPNSDKFDEYSADESNNNEFNSDELRKTVSKKMVNNLKNGRGKKKDLTSGNEYFNTLNTEQQNKINNTFPVIYTKHFRKNVLKNILNFANEMHAVIRTKLLDFVEKILGVITKGHAVRDKVNNYEAGLRNLELNQFLMALTDKGKQMFALKNPNNLLTLDY